MSRSGRIKNVLPNAATIIDGDSLPVTGGTLGGQLSAIDSQLAQTTLQIGALQTPCISSVTTLGIITSNIYNQFQDVARAYDVITGVWTDYYAIPVLLSGMTSLPVYTSKDGITWTQIGTVPMVYANGLRINQIGVAYYVGNPRILLFQSNSGDVNANAILTYDVATMTLQSKLDIGNRSVLSFNHNLTCLGNYIYLAEYTTSTAIGTCRYYRSSDGGTTWTNHTTLIPNYTRIRHFHGIQADPYSEGTLYLYSGDINSQTFIWKTTSYGGAWTVVASNAQDYRTLGFVFDTDYIYWAMDNSDGALDTKFFRCARTNPDLTSKETIALVNNNLAVYNICQTFNPNGILIFSRHEPLSPSAAEILVEFYDFVHPVLYTVARFPTPNANQSGYFGFTTSCRYMDKTRGTILAAFTDGTSTDHYKPYGVATQEILMMTISMGR